MTFEGSKYAVVEPWVNSPESDAPREDFFDAEPRLWWLITFVLTPGLLLVMLIHVGQYKATYQSQLLTSE